MKDLRIPEKKFRPEIEGIRAVAAFLVAVYHIWFGSVSGGVDVFFIVSGYLITTSLLTKMERTGSISFVSYLLGLAKRLFPLAFLVLFVTGVLSVIALPQARWEQVTGEMIASLFYFQNWQLASDAVDYLAQNNQASPLQHYWALSIQGQFYITWPIVIFLSVVLAGKVLKKPVRKTLLSILAITFIASLSYSVYITAVNQPWAYFDSFARVWEFSLGGITALLLPYIALSRKVSFVFGWTGLAIISLTGLILPVSDVFPGYAALLPVSGVMLIIASSQNGGGRGVQRLLGSKWFLYFGRISYAFYLWHWPLLIFYYVFWDRENVTFMGGLFILLTAFFLSVISSKLVESPIRNMKVQESPRKLAGILTLMMFPVLAMTISWNVYVNEMQEELYEQYEVADHPGALVLEDGVRAAEDAELLPTPVQAESDLPQFYDDNCFAGGSSRELIECSYGDTENPKYIVALVGGSHSGHWFPALEEIAEDRKIQIDVYNKDGCRFTSEDFDGRLPTDCMEWNDALMNRLLEDPPDVVFTTANVNESPEIPEGYLEAWGELDGITQIFALRDTPHLGESIPLCIENNSEVCGMPKEEVLFEEIPWEVTDDIPENMTFAELTKYFCDEEECFPTKGNVMIYRDEHHLTTLYARSLAPALEEHLNIALKKSQK
jgi:peptidoglycan/LPS O-acetylase OafA/YrhL